MTSGRHTRSSVQRQRRPFFSAEPYARQYTSAPTPQSAPRSFHPFEGLGDIEGGGALVMGVAGSQRVGVFQGMGWNGRCGGATRAPACIGQLRGMLRIALPRWQEPLGPGAQALSRPLPSATAAWRERTRSTARAVAQAGRSLSGQTHKSNRERGRVDGEPE